jgi:hypothetical protein
MVGSEVIIPIRLAVVHLVQKIRITVIVNRSIEVMIIDWNIVKSAVAVAIIVVLMGVRNSWRTLLGVLLSLLGSGGENINIEITSHGRWKICAIRVLLNRILRWNTLIL